MSRLFVIIYSKGKLLRKGLRAALTYEHESLGVGLILTHSLIRRVIVIASPLGPKTCLATGP